jgi:hypothetical protein
MNAPALPKAFVKLTCRISNWRQSYVPSTSCGIVIVFPGSGVTDNLADKAKAMGIPLFDFRKAAGA